MRAIEVRGSVLPALVDDEDFDRIADKVWRLQKNASGTCYAVHDVRLSPSKVIKLLMHREVLRAVKGKFVDHRNRNGLDNRRQNLREATGRQNAGNRVGVPDSTSKYKGVHWCTERSCWRAQVHYAGVTYRLGRFKVEEDAARAYDEKARELWGEFALLNFGAETESIQRES